MKSTLSIVLAVLVLGTALGPSVSAQLVSKERPAPTGKRCGPTRSEPCEPKAPKGSLGSTGKSEIGPTPSPYLNGAADRKKPDYNKGLETGPRKHLGPDQPKFLEVAPGPFPPAPSPTNPNPPAQKDAPIDCAEKQKPTEVCPDSKMPNQAEAKHPPRKPLELPELKMPGLPNRWLLIPGDPNSGSVPNPNGQSQQVSPMPSPY